MLDLEFTTRADEDYRAATRWYNARSPRAAVGFESAVDRTLDLLRRQPDIGSPADKRHRTFAVGGYPYFVVYRVDASRLTVVAVAHGSQRPGYWRGR